MESANINNFDNQDYNSFVACLRSWLKVLLLKLLAKAAGFAAMTRKIAQDDPRRVIHSVKVGVAITLVSLLYYFQPLYNSFGISAVWAVITVIVVFEFTVGATLGKGLNRAMATLLAGGLGIGALHVASLCGKVGEPFVIGSFVFLLAAVSTFVRFFPKIRARYDYGFLIFILTFSLISISGIRAEETIELTRKRLSTIAIGAFVSLLINIFIFPVWAGEELHNSISCNMEMLGKFLEGFGVAYFESSEVVPNSKDESKSFLQNYTSVLNSKSVEENLANFASWEPGHGQFNYYHPWEEYLKLGVLIRQCAYRIDALNAFFTSDTQASRKLPGEIRETCIKMSLESGKALKELGSNLRTMSQPSASVDAHIVSSKAAATRLQSLLKSGSLWKDCDLDLLEVMPVATVASLLVHVVDCVDEIGASAYELASIACFKKFEGSSEKSKPPNHQHEDVNDQNDRVCPQIVINCGC